MTGSGIASRTSVFRFSRIFLTLPALGVAVLLVAATAPSPAMAACGAKNQTPCKVWERIPSCDKGLKEDFGQNKCVAKGALSCGRLNQRPCLVVERIPSCDKGLVEDFVGNKCQKKGQGSLRQFEKFASDFQKSNRKLMEDVKAYTANLKDHYAYVSSKAFKADREKKRFKQILNKTGIDALVAKLTADPSVYDKFIPRALTIGFVQDGGLGIGASVENGVAINLTKKAPAAFEYRTIGINGGLITGASGTISVTVWNSPPQNLLGENRGMAASGGEIAVAGAGFWFAAPKNAPAAIGYDFKHFQGFGFAAGVGGSISPADIRGTTALTQRHFPPFRADACGKRNIRPCYVFERVPSCDKGLKENFIKHQCVK